MIKALVPLPIIIQHSAVLSKLYWLAKYIRKDPYEVGETAQGRYQDVLSVIPPDAQSNVLELGCGEGVLTALLAQSAVRIVATDISATAIRRARKRLQNRSHVQFCLQDLIHDTLQRDVYSLAICLELLYYVPYDLLDECIAKIWHAVTPGGYVLVGHRRERPQESGWFTIPFAAETIHARFKRLDTVVCVDEIERPGFVLSLFKRTDL